MGRPYRGRARRAVPATIRWTLVRVRGRSMEPTLHDGDLLVVDGHRPAVPASLVVVRLPDRTPAVKRLVRREPEGWWVERDNPLVGTDSWSVGAISESDLVGVVWARVWPRPRRYRPTA